MSYKSGNRILNVGLVGCGEVIQTTHLPTLLYCNHQFKAVAICDVSAEALEHCARKFQVGATYQTVQAMLDGSPEIDLVMIMNSDCYHARDTILAADAGKHVFLEKPMAICHEDADAIEAARTRNNVVIFIGYMRRYAEAFLRAKEVIRGMKIDYVRVRDIIGNNAFFTSQSGSFPQKFGGYPEEAVRALQTDTADKITSAIGTEAADDPLNAHSWSLLGSLASHDMSAMRELVGVPQSVLAATRSPDGWFWSVLFQHDGFNTYYEMGIDKVAKFDAHLEVYGSGKRVKIQYDTPYVKGLPTTLTIESMKENGYFSTEVIRPSFVDNYTLEYQELYDAVVNGKEYKTTPLDAKEDLKINDMIWAALRK